MSKKNGKKKKKIIYVDDGRTIVDMSGVPSGLSKAPGHGKPMRMRSSFSDRRQTYMQAVRMMFVPMLITIGVICAAFGIMWLLAKASL